MIDFIIENIVLIATGITAFNTILTALFMFGKHSKNGINRYITKSMQPSFDTIMGAIKELSEEIADIKYNEDQKETSKLRYECLKFASDIRKGVAKTRQEYEEIFRMESDYDKLIEKYDIENGFMEEEMLYVHNQYRKLMKP